MINIKKAAAAAVSITLASTLIGCTPTIGAGSKTALTVDSYEIPAGLFIYFTLQGYDEASQILKEKNGTAPTAKELRNSRIDSLDSTDWIQDKATEYCVKYAAIAAAFDEIGGELSKEDLDDAALSAEYVLAQNSRYDVNGVSLETVKKISENTYKEQAVFDYYYGFDGEEGCSEEELKDYFDDNFARIKCVTISLIGSDGEKLNEDEIRKRRKLAEEYAKEINSKSNNKQKFTQADKAIEEYDEYVAAQTTAAEGEAVTTTTTTTTTADPDETTTTTTTNPYANERLIQKNTTTTAASNSEDTETEPVEPTESEKNQSKFNDYVFNTLTPYKAEVYEFDSDTIYVVIRGDLRERMTEDDYWTEGYISSLQSMRFYDNFVAKMDAKAESMNYEKNKSAYRRYAPFKLEIE